MLLLDAHVDDCSRAGSYEIIVSLHHSKLSFWFDLIILNNHDFRLDNCNITSYFVYVIQTPICVVVKLGVVGSLGLGVGVTRRDRLDGTVASFAMVPSILPYRSWRMLLSCKYHLMWWRWSIQVFVFLLAYHFYQFCSFLHRRFCFSFCKSPVSFITKATSVWFRQRRHSKTTVSEQHLY